jgi:uncharacterized protein (DUF362 family)
MSFLIDPILLFFSGLAIYYLGRKMDWNRHAKIVVGLVIASLFIIFSTLLCTDLVRCTFPFFSQLSGSRFMLHSDLTNIEKSSVPQIVVLFFFLLYPVWIFAGYALALLIEKKRLVSQDIYTYSDVRSKSRMKAGLNKSYSLYAVTRGKDTRQCVRDAIDRLGGIERFVKNGDKVLVKVNICGGVPEKKGTFTSLEVADVLADLIQSAGGKPTFVDADMIWIKFWEAAKESGYVDWAKEKGVDLVNLSEKKIVNFDFGPDSALGMEKVSMELIDADVIISVPAMKTHLLTGVTLAMKNMYGTFPNVDKAKYHKKSIEDTIYEVNSAFTPNLVIIDGSMGGEAIGPLSADPVYYQTIIASNDVVMGDSIAAQMMGYNPLDITHIKMAHERGLGNASAELDIDDLPGHVKDRNWIRPDPKVKDFYEWAIELILMLPGWQTLFNIGADFFLYDMARLPVFNYLSSAALKLLQDVVYVNLKENKSTPGDVARRIININLMVLVALGCAIGYYLDGYINHSSLIFELSYLAAIFVGFLAAARMKTVHFAALLAISALVCLVVEKTNTEAGLLVYHNGANEVTLFTISGWMLMMLVIIQLSDLLTGWLKGLGIFKALRSWKLLPFALVLAAFSLFFYWEGYLNLAIKSEGGIVLIMYVAMAVLGLIYSSRHAIEWNASLMVVALALGGYMELLGSQAGFWSYHFGETLSVFFALTWPLNTMAVHGLAYLVGIDLGASEKRHLFSRRFDPKEKELHEER